MRESRDVNGEYEGMWVSWYENGQKWKQGRFKKEKKDGKWITWNENGQIISERVYKKGEKI